MAKIPWWVWASVVACAAASLVSLSSRHKVETSNRAVGIMMAMEDIEAIAATTPLQTSTVIEELQKHGLTGIAFTDQTVGDLIDRGEANYVMREEILFASINGSSPVTLHPAIEFTAIPPRVVLDTDSNLVSIETLAQDRIDQIVRVLNRLSRVSPRIIKTNKWNKSESVDWEVWDPEKNSGITLVKPVRIYSWAIPENLEPMYRDLTVGIDSRYSRVCDELGLEVIARLNNDLLVNERRISEKILIAKKSGASSFLIAGDQAIGNRDLLETTREALIENDMQYISPEFVTLGGDSFLRRELADRTIRLHSISALEAERMSLRDLNERFAKAFRERGVRWLLFRPNTKASDDTLKQVGETLVSLRSAIRSAGGEVKEPRPFEDSAVPNWLIGLIGALAIPAVMWAALSVCGNGALGWSATGLYVALAITTFLYEDASKLALLTAIAFPIVGYLIVSRFEKPNPIRDFLAFTAISMVGGLVVGATLVGTEFMIRADQFTGVKLALFAPIFIVGYLLLKRHGTIKELLAKPVTWSMAVVAIAGLAAMFMLAARSGNENPAAVSGFELQIRSLLDQLLFVRPRSKEVILGHPALVLGLMMMLYRPNLKGWASLLLFVGMIGQTSVVNTFCHLHTPIALSLARVGVGVVCGGIIGLILWYVVQRWIPSEETAK